MGTANAVLEVLPKALNGVGMVNTNRPLFGLMVHGDVLKAFFTQRPVATQTVGIHD